MRLDSITISKLVNGRHYGTLKYVSSYFIDSNKAVEDSAFFAIKGSRTDGHLYIQNAMDNGARLIFIDKSHSSLVSKFSDRKVSFIVVPSPFKALQDLACFVRIKSKARIIGITGSCGKTTTKEMIASILAQKGKTVKTPENYNSEYGLPLSILQLDEDTEYGVFEIGTDRRGMMREASAVLGPEYALITNIGISHLANYTSREEIAYEKSDIFLPYTKGYVPHDMDYLDLVKTRCTDLKIAEDVIQSYFDLGFEGYKFKYNDKWAHLPLLGLHNLKNLSLAIALVKDLGVDDEMIFRGILNIPDIFGRNRIVKKEGVTIIEDCYNANGDSMKSALKTLSSLNWKNGRKIAVLADMCFLGSLSRREHIEVAKTLLNTDCQRIYLYGKEMLAAYEFLKEMGDERPLFYTGDFNLLFEIIKNEIIGGDLLLLKGSRAMLLESLYSAFRKTS